MGDSQNLNNKMFDFFTDINDFIKQQLGNDNYDKFIDVFKNVSLNPKSKSAISFEKDDPPNKKIESIIQYLNQLKVADDDSSVIKAKQYKDYLDYNVDKNIKDLYNSNTPYYNIFSIYAVYENLRKIFKTQSSNKVNYKSNAKNSVEIINNKTGNTRKLNLFKYENEIYNVQDYLNNDNLELLSDTFKELEKIAGKDINSKGFLDDDFKSAYLQYNVEIKKCHLYSLFYDFLKFIKDNEKLLGENINNNLVLSGNENKEMINEKKYQIYDRLFDEFILQSLENDNPSKTSIKEKYKNENPQISALEIPWWEDRKSVANEKKDSIFLIEKKIIIEAVITHMMLNGDSELVKNESFKLNKERECNLLNSVLNSSGEIPTNNEDFLMNVKFDTSKTPGGFNDGDLNKDCKEKISIYKQKQDLAKIFNKMITNYNSILIFIERLNKLKKDIPTEIDKLKLDPEILETINKIQQETRELEIKSITNEKLLVDEKYEYNKNILRGLIYLSGILLMSYLMYTKTKKNS